MILNQGLLQLHERGDLGDHPTIYLSQTVIKEVERLANIRKEAGIIGLGQLTDLRDHEAAGELDIELVGDRPDLDAVKLNIKDGGEMDARIVQDARLAGATLVTSDRVQAQVSRVYGLPTVFLEPPHETGGDHVKRAQIERYFDDQTLSVHLKEDAIPYAKKGAPGAWRLADLDDQPLTVDHLRELASDIIGFAKEDPKSFIEINTKNGISVVQLREYRIVITRPPFASGFEITAVRPLVSLEIEDYHPSRRLLKKFDRAEGILVCGSPGAGKSTFVAALAKYYTRKNKIVKTLESIRDLQVPPAVTQYQLYDKHAVDVLLLVRPDYTLFDEVRNGSDFRKYADLRLAGVGMVGVVHSSSAIDSIQRFIPHLELGMIPNIIDTIVFIAAGQIHTVYSLELTVTTPRGFKDQALARPVIQVTNHETRVQEFEIYTFGDHVVVSPTSKGSRKGAFEKYHKRRYEPSGGKSHGGNANSGHGKSSPTEVRPGFIPLEVRATKRSVILSTLKKFAHHTVTVGVDDRTLFTGTIGSKGDIRVGKSSKVGSMLLKALKQGRDVWAEVQ